MAGINVGRRIYGGLFIPDISEDDLSTLQTIYVARGPQTVNTTEILEGWIIFTDDFGVAQMLADKLQSADQDAILVKPGDAFRRESKTPIWIPATRMTTPNSANTFCSTASLPGGFASVVPRHRAVGKFHC